jgi:hypothetical protein
MALYHSLLALATNQPVGRFNKRFDFRGVEVKTINKCVRLIKNRLITDPDDAKLVPKDWFLYPSQSVTDGTTIEATLFEKTLSTQLSQILACTGYFIGTEDMVAWKNSIKQITDEPRLAKIADDYRIKAHVLFWASLGFADVECPAPSATQFVQYYMTRAQNSFCIKTLYASAGAGGDVIPPKKKKKRLRSDSDDSSPKERPTKIAKTDSLVAGTLPSVTGTNAKPNDKKAGSVPWVWAAHIRQFPATYGTTKALLTSDPNITEKCLCAIGGGLHSPEGCMARLVINKWSKQTLPATASKLDIRSALTKLKAARGIKERV